MKKGIIGLAVILVAIFIFKLSSGPAGTPERMEKFEWIPKYYKQKPELHIEFAKRKISEQIDSLNILRPKLVTTKQYYEQTNDPNDSKNIADADTFIEQTEALIPKLEKTQNDVLSNPPVSSTKMEAIFALLKGIDAYIQGIRIFLQI